MKEVRFLQDFQGVETRNVFYKSGSVHSFEDDLADRLIVDGRAKSTFIHSYVDETAQFENAATPPHEEKHYGGQAESAPRHDEELYPVEQVEVIQPKKRGRK